MATLIFSSSQTTASQRRPPNQVRSGALRRTYSCRCWARPRRRGVHQALKLSSTPTPANLTSWRAPETTLRRRALPKARVKLNATAGSAILLEARPTLTVYSCSARAAIAITRRRGRSKRALFLKTDLRLSNSYNTNRYLLFWRGAWTASRDFQRRFPRAED